MVDIVIAFTSTKTYLWLLSVDTYMYMYPHPMTGQLLPIHITQYASGICTLNFDLLCELTGEIDKLHVELL